MADEGAVNNLPKYWLKKFAAIEKLPKNESGRPTIKNAGYRLKLKTYSFRGFVFGPFYYLKLRMYQKAALLFAVFALLLGTQQILEAGIGNLLPQALSSIMDCAIYFYGGAFVALDYYNFRHFGDKFWGPQRLQSNWMVAAMTGASLIFAVWTVATFDSPSDLLTNVSGVWRDNNGEVVKIDFSGEQKTISMNDATSSCEFKNADTGSNIVVLNCTRKDGMNAIIAIRKIVHSDGSFNIGISIDDAQEEKLTYVRPI